MIPPARGSPGETKVEPRLNQAHPPYSQDDFVNMQGDYEQQARVEQSVVVDINSETDGPITFISPKSV